MHGKIHGFDGLRGLAVITVILTHLGVYGELHKSGKLSSGVLDMISGDAGVHLFFVLSGLLITLLLVQEMQATGRIDIKRFYMRRILRIFPLYFLLVFLVAALQWVGNAGVPTRSFLYSFTYTYNFIPRADYAGVLGHTWSLAVEEHYYLVWPFVFAALFLRKRALLMSISGVALVACVYLEGKGLDAFRRTYFVDRWTVTAMTSVLVGSVFGILMVAQDTPHWIKRALRAHVVLPIAVALYAHTLWWGVLPYELGKPIRAAAIGLLLCYLLAHQKSLFTAALEFPPLRYLGVISYGVYIWQGFFLSTGPGRFAGQTWPPDQMTGLILLALVAPLSYHGLEKPILRFKARFAVARGATAKPSSSVAADTMATRGRVSSRGI